MISPAPSMMRKISQRSSQITATGGGLRGKRARRRERAQEDREEAGLDQLDLPAVAVPELADLDDRELERPEQRELDRVREAEEQRQRERNSEQAGASSAGSETSSQKKDG